MAQLHLDPAIFAPMPPSNPFRPAVVSAPAPEADDADAGFVMLQSGPPVSAAECEDATASSVEIMMLWGTTVLHTQHLTPPRAFFVGEQSSKKAPCDFVIPAEKLGTTRTALIVIEEGEPRLVVPAGAKLTVKRGGAAIESDGRPCHSDPTATTHALVGGASYDLALGDLTVRVAAVAAGKRTPRAAIAAADRGSLFSFGLAALCTAGVMSAMAFFVPPMGLTDDEGLDRDRIAAIQQYLSASAEREREREEIKNDGTTEQKGSSEAAEAAMGESGKMGKVGAPNTNKRVAVKGPQNNPDPHLAREQALREARTFGLIGILNDASGDPNAPTVPWGRDSSLGTDMESANGNMWGDEIGESGGSGGLGLSGLGLGGGGRGEGIGLGGIGTCGSAVCAGLEGGFGRSLGRTGPEHKAKAPIMRPGSTEILSGTLPAEVVQRIVRQNFGRFRMCYENGLKANPNLTGRVAVRFVIGRDGAVSNVGNAGSDIPDSGVVSCVISAYYGLSFPAPKDGIVTVTYPIMFSPG